jgi:alanine racemase
MTALHEPTIATDELRPDLSGGRPRSRWPSNYRAIAAHVAPARVMPILKANAYGHGLVEVARLLERVGAPYLGVGLPGRGLRLRQHGVKMPVLVLGGIDRLAGAALPGARSDPDASSVDKLRAIDECAAASERTATVHLKIDTGMERIGVHWYSAEKLLEESLRCRHLRVEGIFTHFANADTAISSTRACSSSASPRCCASTSGARCRRRCATPPTRAPSCSCPRATWIWSGPASSLWRGPSAEVPATCRCRRPCAG